MKKVTIMVPYSWDDERINNVVEAYKKDGYEVTILGIPG